MLMRRGYMQRSCAHELLGEFIFIFFCFSFLANIIKSISSPFLLGGRARPALVSKRGSELGGAPPLLAAACDVELRAGEQRR